jgi:hypothetical protein
MRLAEEASDAMEEDPAKSAGARPLPAGAPLGARQGRGSRRRMRLAEGVAGAMEADPAKLQMGGEVVVA